MRKNQSKFQTTAFLPFNIHILIDFYAMTFLEKEAFNFGTSLFSRFSHLSIMDENFIIGIPIQCHTLKC